MYLKPSTSGIYIMGLNGYIYIMDVHPQWTFIAWNKSINVNISSAMITTGYVFACICRERLGE